MPASRDRRTAPSPPRRSLLWWPTAFALLLVGLALSWHTTGDLDAPLHDRLGRDILAGRGVPATNHFSFTAPDHPWADHEWGFQVALALSGRLAGGDDLAGRAAGWQWLRLLLTLALLLALLRMLRAVPAALLGPVMVVALALLWTRLTIRPELVSGALLVLVLGRIETALRHDSGAAWWRELLDPRLPGGQVLLLALLWYQCHGFAVLAPLMWLLAGALGRSPRRRAARWRLAAGGATLALAAGAVAPAGIAGLLLPLRVAGQFQGGVDLQHTISELVPLLETRGSLAATLGIFKLSLVWGLVWTVLTWPRVSRLRLALWLLAAVAAWQGQRNLGVYALTFALLHGDLAGTAAPPWRHLVARLPERLAHGGGRVASVALPVATWIAVGLWIVALANDTFYLREGVARRWGGGVTPAVYPERQAAGLAAAGQLRVANTVDAASSLIAAGAGPVSIDGRTEAYPVGVWRAYGELKQGGNAAIRRLQGWRAEAVCVAHRNAASHALLTTLLGHPGWSLIDADPAGAVLRPRSPDDPSPADIFTRVGKQLRAELDAAPPGRDVRLADRLAAWATLLVVAGRETAAEDILVSARDRCPDHPIVLHNLGNLLLARGELRGSLRLFEEAARLNRNAAPPLVNAGNCLFQLGRVADAERTLARAVGRDPRNFEGWANLAEARRQLGDRRGAVRAYERALELRPGEARLRQRARTLGSS